MEFSIHEGNPPVQQLVVHPENGQRVYFTEDNTLDRALGDPYRVFLHFAVWIALPRPSFMWLFPSTILGTASLGADRNIAQM